MPDTVKASEIIPTRRLTLKQRKFVKEYISNGGNGTKAVLKTYNTDDVDTAKVIASENLTKPNIQNTIEQSLRDIGLTPEKLLGNLNSIASVEVEKVTADAKIKANVELLKLYNAYPDKKSYKYSLNVRGKIKDMSFQDAQKELKQAQTEYEEFEADVEQ